MKQRLFSIPLTLYTFVILIPFFLLLFPLKLKDIYINIPLLNSILFPYTAFCSLITFYFFANL